MDLAEAVLDLHHGPERVSALLTASEQARRELREEHGIDTDAMITAITAPLREKDPLRRALFVYRHPWATERDHKAALDVMASALLGVPGRPAARRGLRVAAKAEGLTPHAWLQANFPAAIVKALGDCTRPRRVRLARSYVRDDGDRVALIAPTHLPVHDFSKQFRADVWREISELLSTYGTLGEPPEDVKVPADGHNRVEDEMIAMIDAEPAEAPPVLTAEIMTAARLSGRERQVLNLLSELSNVEIARRLDVSPQTVNTLLGRCRKKLARVVRDPAAALPLSAFVVRARPRTEGEIPWR